MMTQLTTKTNEDYIVKDEYCLGCKYYGSLSGDKGVNKCCTYYPIEKKHRPNDCKPSECTVKEIGERLKWDVGK